MAAEDYQDPSDVRDATITMREIEAGTMPIVVEADVDAYLAAQTPLAFWRTHRGMKHLEPSRQMDGHPAY
jgi:hypothetical protein